MQNNFILQNYVFPGVKNRNRLAFVTTVTEDIAMAAPATTG